MNQYNKNLLKKNFQDWAIFSIINNTKLNDRPVVGWKILAGKKVTVEVVFHIIRKFRDEIVVRAVNIKERETLMKLTAGGYKLNFYLPDDLVLFQTEVKHIERNGDLRVSMPKMVAQVDRRKDLRLFFENGVEIDLEFEKSNHTQNKVTQKFKKTFFDISAGGSSFIISKSEKGFFKMNDQVEGIKVRFGKKELKFNASIINILEEKPNKRNGLIYQGWKVCLKHHYLNELDRKLIEGYVFKFVDFSDVI